MLCARAACKDEVVRCASEDRSILCVEADLGGRNNPFQQAYPERYFNFGIAEMAALDICTGMASAGLRPVFTSFAPFLALRCVESIKLAMGYMNQPIVLIGEYGGTAGGWFGTTHHSLEDIGAVRLIPGIRIACPYGEREARQVIRRALTHREPTYIRVGRNDVYDELSYEPMFESISIESPWINHAHITLVSIGEKATEICTRVKSQNRDINHAHLCYVDNQSLRSCLDELNELTECLIVVEEHRRAGCVGGELSLLLPEKQVVSCTVDDGWTHTGGTQDQILALLHFSYDEVQRAVEKNSNSYGRA